MELIYLPTEMLEGITEHLDGKDIHHLRITCKRFHRDLEFEFKKSRIYKVFLHNFYLGFHLMNCLHFVPEEEYLKHYLPKCSKYDKFVISRIGDVWPWQNYGGLTKAVMCQCGGKLCRDLYYVIEPTLKVETLRYIIRNFGTTKSYIHYAPGLEEGCREADKKLTHV